MLERGTSYFGVRDPEHAAADLDKFESTGLNAVLHTFSERDQRYYERTMADIVAASADRGFRTYVNPWGVGRVFGGEALSEFIGRNPESRQKLSNGDRVAAACFNDPVFRSFMRDWTVDAAGLGADVLFWDEPHWFIPEWHGDDLDEDVWTCQCESCRAAFKDRYGEPMPEEETEAVREFRQASLLDFLEEMMELTRDEGAENAVCMLPSMDADYGLEDWSTLASNEHLDVLATDPYWSSFDSEVESFVREFSQRVADLAEEHDLESQIWIQGFRLPEGEVENVRTATRTAIDAGVDSVFMWGWDACRTISSIACEEPEAVWNAYLDELPAE